MLLFTKMFLKTLGFIQLNFKGVVHPKILTLKLFQTCMKFFMFIIFC